jgi:hypothetical protein
VVEDKMKYRYPMEVVWRALELHDEGHTANVILAKLGLEFLETDVPLHEETIRRWIRGERPAKPTTQPAVNRPREEHFAQLAQLVNGLLQNHLQTLSKVKTDGVEKYAVWDGGSPQDKIWYCQQWSPITDDWIYETFERNQELMSDFMPELMVRHFGYLKSHLKSELPELESKGFSQFAKENPMSLLRPSSSCPTGIHSKVPVKSARTGRSQTLAIIPYTGYNTHMADIYSVAEAAKKLNLDPSQVRRLLRAGEIEGRKLGHDWVVLSLDYKRKRKPKQRRQQ